VASTISDETAGNADYQQGHMGLIFKDGFSFSGYERDGLFLNQGGKRFKDISGISGIDSILDGRSVVVADFDNDGDEDIFVTSIQDEGHLLFRNNVGQQRNFLRIDLEGTTSGKDAFGAVVRIKTANGTQTRIKSGGNGFLAYSDPRLVFGLGDLPTAEWLEVSWPSGLKQGFDGLKAGKTYRITEGEADSNLLTDRRFSLPDPVSETELVWEGLAVKPGDPTPHLELTNLATGKTQTLIPGQPYLLNFWATWCGPCRKEMPELEKMQPALQKAGIQLLGVSVDLDIDPAQVLSVAQSMGVSYPVLSIPQSDWEKIFEAGNLVVPLTLFVDESGKVRQSFSGWNNRTEESLRKLAE
jgi:thiol-disulfide isomerase/thioredoxin